MARTTAQGALPGVKRFKLHAPVIRESVLHKQIADALKLELCAPGRLSRDGVTWWSVDMAAYAGSVPGIRTGRGCIAGVPDIFVLYRGLAYFLEVKADDGVVSPAQQAVATTILYTHAPFGVVRSVEETLACIDNWGIPRAHRIRG
jgi:hypothetical protein